MHRFISFLPKNDFVIILYQFQIQVGTCRVVSFYDENIFYISVFNAVMYNKILKNESLSRKIYNKTDIIALSKPFE